PARAWSAPSLAPATALAVLSGLYMLDNLSNAMFNPIYLLAAGGLAGLASRRVPTEEPDESPHESPDVGGPLFLAALALDRDDGGQGDLSPDDQAALTERERAWRSVLQAFEEPRDALAGGVDLRPYEARARGRLGRILARLGRMPEAVAECEAALALREAMCVCNPSDPATVRELADARNDVAWLLAVVPGISPEVAERSASLARETVRSFSDDPSYWNTLGAAYCRLGDWPAVVHALGRSAALSGGTIYDHLLLAIAHAQRGDRAQAIRAFEAAEARLNPGNRWRRDSSSLRHEAESLIDRSTLA
ncbi:MAG: tetratricopeptide repeat protein, partial [Isosphaeraceae bacterium]|nr:tetratricopeptide repeat protein [Isosphaeraceae bacterium]